MVQDVERQKKSPLLGDDAGNQSVVDYNLYIQGVAYMPTGNTNTLNGGKERPGAYRLTNGILNIYVGDGIWQEYMPLDDNAIPLLDIASMISYSKKGDTVIVKDKLRGGIFNYVESGLTTDDGIVFPATGRGGGFWQRQYDSPIYADWFGAIADGTTDNYDAITRAVDSVNAKGGGTLNFRHGVYLTSPFLIKQNVNLIGSAFQPSGTLSSLSASNVASGTTLRCVFTETVNELFIGYVPDHTFTSQIGLESGLPKSNPKSLIQNLVIDSNNACKIGLEFFESWGNSIRSCRLINAKSYNLSVFDCNEFIVQSCAITNVLSYSNADFKITECDIQGTDGLPALFSAYSGNGLISNNNIFYSPLDSSQLNLNVISVDQYGVFSLEQQETGNPGWTISPAGSTNGSFTYDEPSDTLDMTSINGLEFAVVSSLLARLDKGSTYRITFGLKLLDSSVSATRTIRHMSGNQQQTYGVNVLSRGVDTPVDHTFVFNPSNPATNPIKFLVDAKASVVGNDIIRITNLDIQAQDLSGIVNKTPFIFYSNTGDLPVGMENGFNFTVPYFIKFISPTTFKLFASRKDYDDGLAVLPSSDITDISGLFLAPPKAVVPFIGAASNQGISNNMTVSGNKIEDIRTKGVLLRGVYSHNFTANNITKGINDTGDSECVKLEYGASENVFSGGFIGNRYLLSSVDRINTAVHIDKSSYRNTFAGIATGTGSRYIDIIDEFNGQSSMRNIFDSNVIDSTYCGIARSSDYLPKVNPTLFNAATINNIQAVNGLIADTEFTLYFSDINFLTSTGDSVFFKQNIPSTTTAGRVEIKRNSSGAIVVTITSTVVYQSANGVLANNTPYDLVFTRDIGAGWNAHINGVLLIPASSAVLTTAAPTGATVRTYIGSDTTIADSYSISRFRYFNDILSEKEIMTLFSSKFLDKPISTIVPILNQATDNINGTGTLDISVTNSSTSGYKNTKGATCVISSANHKIQVNNLTGTAKIPLRASFYIKTSDPTLIDRLAFDRYQVSNIANVTSDFTRVTILAFPDMPDSNITGATLRFGKELLQGFTASFIPASSGTVVISTMKIWNCYIPCVVDIDMTSGKYGKFNNRMSTTTFPTWYLLDDYSYITKLGSSVTDYSLDLSSEFIPNTASMAVYVNGIGFSGTSYNRTTKILSGLPETISSDIIQIII